MARTKQSKTATDKSKTGRQKPDSQQAAIATSKHLVVSRRYESVAKREGVEVLDSPDMLDRWGHSIRDWMFDLTCGNEPPDAAGTILRFLELLKRPMTEDAFDLAIAIAHETIYGCSTEGVTAMREYVARKLAENG